MEPFENCRVFMLSQMPRTFQDHFMTTHNIAKTACTHTTQLSRETTLLTNVESFSAEFNHRIGSFCSRQTGWYAVRMSMTDQWWVREADVYLLMNERIDVALRPQFAICMHCGKEAEPWITSDLRASVRSEDLALMSVWTNGLNNVVEVFLYLLLY